MRQRIYVERAVANHPRAMNIMERFRDPEIVYCKRYAEVFNPRQQNFRLQKRRPALILAAKNKGHVLAAPPGYGFGDDAGHYFSHMLNCPYDCRYCFLQGMFRSANYVVFVNFEDFENAIERELAASDGALWFNSGYDCDSLAYDPVTGFVDYFVPVFAAKSEARLEIRTKSTQIRSLLKHEAVSNVVIAFSFTPVAVNEKLESLVPTVDRRIAAAKRLQAAGWPVAVRFEPLIHFDGFNDAYRALVNDVLGALDSDRIHSVSVGSFRMPDAFFARTRALYPREALFSAGVESREGMTGYTQAIAANLAGLCREAVLRHVDEARFYHCAEASL